MRKKEVQVCGNEAFAVMYGVYINGYAGEITPTEPVGLYDNVLDAAEKVQEIRANGCTEVGIYKMTVNYEFLR